MLQQKYLFELYWFFVNFSFSNCYFQMSGSTFSDFTGSSESVAHSLAPITVPALHVIKQSVEVDLRDVQALETAASRALFGDVDISNYM